ncbi:MAG: putative metal-binding motif-containing protein [Proteobacteria bacterium]|nr:putative metal-binding motif-containing protein [Pseudomonadota bacterium]
MSRFSSVRRLLIVGASVALPIVAHADPPGAAECAGLTGQAKGQCIAWFANDCDVDPSKQSCQSLLNQCNVLTIWADDDSDGFGSGTSTDVCGIPAGFVEVDGDCDDTDATVNPSATEVCGDGIDNNCDGAIDEGCAPECPCYTTADLQDSWDRYQASVYGTYDNDTIYCREVQGTSATSNGVVHWSHATLYYDSYTYNAWNNNSATRFHFTTRLDNITECRTNEYAFFHDGQHNLIYQDYTVIDGLTVAEQASCQTTLLDWAASAGLTCPLEVYAY